MFLAKMMTPLSFHEPPALAEAFETFCDDPPLISIRRNSGCAKNPTDPLSGDQNGNVAASVDGSGRAEPDSSERIHNRGRPSDEATKTIFCPSGEIASDAGFVVGGVAISRRTSAGSGNGRKARTLVTIAST